MLKEDKLKRRRMTLTNSKTGETEEFGDIGYGFCKFEGYYDTLYAFIMDKDILKEINDDKFYFAEVTPVDVECDYHTYSIDQTFRGVFLAFDIPKIEETIMTNDELNNILENIKNEVSRKLSDENFVDNRNTYNIILNDRGCFVITIEGRVLDDETLDFAKYVLSLIQEYFSLVKNLPKKEEQKELKVVLNQN